MARLQTLTATVKFSDDDEVQARSLRALHAQWEALGVRRREKLSEDDFPENRRATPRASTLEMTRRINLEGTTESQVSDSVRGRLSIWSNAWTALGNDEAARENLTDINAGQTHRASLAFRVSEQRLDTSTNVHAVGHGDARYRGSDRARGGGRGGRGGGYAGSRRSRHGPTRIPVGLQPIDEVTVTRATNGNMTISRGRRRVSPSIGSQIAVSLADPDTFMAAVGRKITTKTSPSKATSVTSSHDNAAKTALYSQGVSPIGLTIKDEVAGHEVTNGRSGASPSTFQTTNESSLPDSPSSNSQTTNECSHLDLIDITIPEDPQPPSINAVPRVGTGSIFGESVYRHRYDPVAPSVASSVASSVVSLAEGICTTQHVPW